MLKLRIYDNKGNFKNEEMFDNIDALNARYFELAAKCKKHLAPTAWKKDGENWERMANY